MDFTSPWLITTAGLLVIIAIYFLLVRKLSKK